MYSQSILSNRLKGFVVLSFFILICFNAVLAQAQGMRNSNYRYFGFEANFGMKSTKLTSDLPALNNMAVMEEGGSLGFVMGNQLVKTRLQAAGFYYSNSSVKQTVNMVESALQLNVYPLKFINKSRQAINPYVSGGIDYSTLKFFGYYNNPDAKINYSASSAPYIGKISMTRGTVGGGIEWRLPQMHDFVHIFAEARYSWAMGQDADDFFENTKVANATSINVGVSFGFLR
ncbi:hypothetical protein [Chryseolinea sp. H1M3-3]|uniref:hypothetical protein n=1 Tax=Chryseolinea sp. H1M3-3 TaxID=3034144 RepID=UPI0023ED5876|nr:hypothetical protein [Chryseolinea sp. H1M3-3]